MNFLNNFSINIFFRKDFLNPPNVYFRDGNVLNVNFKIYLKIFKRKVFLKAKKKNLNISNSTEDDIFFLFNGHVQVVTV